jgi:hypothetical protein
MLCLLKIQSKKLHMKKIIFACLATLVLLKGYGQDNNKESRPVPTFHGVEVSDGIDLYLSQGPASVAITAASENIRRHMITEVVDGILRIHLEKDWQPDGMDTKMKAYVSIPSVDQLEASGGGDIYFQTEITASKLRLELSGGGNLEGKIQADNLSIDQSGGSNVHLSGKVKELQVNASGGGSLKGYGLVADFARINASGGSHSEITVNKELRVASSGGSDVYYKGMAMTREINSSGGGSVTHKD